LEVRMYLRKMELEKSSSSTQAVHLGPDITAAAFAPSSSLMNNHYDPQARPDASVDETCTGCEFRDCPFGPADLSTRAFRVQGQM